MVRKKYVQFDEREHTLSANAQPLPSTTCIKPILKSSSRYDNTIPGNNNDDNDDYNEDLETLRRVINRCFVLCNTEIDVPLELEYESVVMLFSELARVIPQNFKERVRLVQQRLASQHQDHMLRQDAVVENLKLENQRLRKMLECNLAVRHTTKPFEKTLQSLVRDSVNRRETELKLADLQCQYNDLRKKYIRLSESSVPSSYSSSCSCSCSKCSTAPAPQIPDTQRQHRANTQELENRCLALIQERTKYQQEVNNLRRELREAHLLLRVGKLAN